MAKKFFTITSNILLGIILLVGILIVVSLLPVKNNIKILSVMSGSMEPTIKTGSLIVVRPAENYQVGDIITFITPAGKSAKDYTTHRIFSIDGSIFKTRGDANNAPDGWIVNQSDIIGKHYVTVPYLGYLIGYIKTLPGLVLLIIIPATIIIYEESKKVHKEAKTLLKKRRGDKIKKQDKSNSTSKPPVLKKRAEASKLSKPSKGEGSKDDTKVKRDS